MPKLKTKRAAAKRYKVMVAVPSALGTVDCVVNLEASRASAEGTGVAVPLVDGLSNGVGEIGRDHGFVLLR